MSRVTIRTRIMSQRLEIATPANAMTSAANTNCAIRIGLARTAVRPVVDRFLVDMRILLGDRPRRESCERGRTACAAQSSAQCRTRHEALQAGGECIDVARLNQQARHFIVHDVCEAARAECNWRRFAKLGFNSDEPQSFFGERSDECGCTRQKCRNAGVRDVAQPEDSLGYTQLIREFCGGGSVRPVTDYIEHYAAPHSCDCADRRFDSLLCGEPCDKNNSIVIAVVARCEL